MIFSNEKRKLDIELDENTYWSLVMLGAEIQMDHETYAEHILIGHVENELDKKAKD